MSKGGTQTALDPLDELSESLRPHPYRAQILLEVKAEGETLEKALSILKALTIHPVTYHVLRKGNPSWISLYLPVEDMREAVLKLTEAGFTRLKGINARSAGSTDTKI